jgi:UDP-4-amino-4,6-dideoxy-N-acetyl-beta-L-altrosamine N-acetyltransferase
MVEADLEQVLLWRNHPDVRRYMYTNHEIGFDEHRAWFAKTSNSPAASLLIYEHHGEATGFVSITRGRCEEVADWGFYLSPGSEKGAGRSLGKLALDYSFAELGLHKLCGQVLGFNERSISFHKSLGFVEEGRLREQHFDGTVYHDIVCFGLLSRERSSKAMEKDDE